MPSLGVPRLPLIPDPLRRIDVPRDLSDITDVGSEDSLRGAKMTRASVDRIWRSAEQLFRGGVYPALQLCVRRNGQVVLNRALGWARLGPEGDPPGAARVVGTTETPYVIFSASKAMAATVAHLLDDRGDLHIADRVAEYIPEYAQHGKGSITIEHVLSHRAGVANLPAEILDLENVGDRDLLLKTMCEARPRTRPGKLLAYHAVSGGFILAEIVERVTGKDIRTVMREEILDPLGFRWGNFGVAAQDVGAVGHSYVTGPPPLPPLSTILERALGLHPDEITRLSNDDRFLTGVIPAANVVTSANELSRFYRAAALRGRARRRPRHGGPHDPPRDRRARLPRIRPHPRRADAPFRRFHARRRRAVAVRPRHRQGVRPPRLHQRARLGGPGARPLRGPHHLRQADPAPGPAAAVVADAEDRRRGRPHLARRISTGQRQVRQVPAGRRWESGAVRGNRWKSGAVGVSRP